MIRVLVVDDDAVARTYLRQLLTAHGKAQVVGEADSLASAREFLSHVECDLILLDLALGAEDGFELVPDVPPSTRIVVITAHDQHALRAFEVNALDYLVKPVSPARLAASLARRAPAVPMRRLDEVVHLRDGRRARLVRLWDISVIEAEENYTRVHLADRSNILVRRPLKSWEDELPRSHFMRIHRTGIVNLAHVSSYRRDPAGGISVEIQKLGQTLPVGRTYWPALKARLGPDVASASPFAAA